MKKMFVVFMLLLPGIITAQYFDVYIGGSYNGYPEKACYWINGNMEIIDGISINAIFVEGTALERKIYTAGVYREYTAGSGTVSVCRYWINGDPFELPGCRVVRQIIVENNKVYVLGDFEDKETYYWINGVRQPRHKDGEIRNISVVNGVVYTAGYYAVNDNYYACYWINGVRHELENSLGFPTTHGIEVLNGKIYIGATQGVSNGIVRASYWIDGKQNVFTVNDAWPNDAFIVSGGNVYMIDGNKCVMYINGVRRNFKAQRFIGTKFFVKQDKMFIAGGYFRPGSGWPDACYWIDEVPHDLYALRGTKGPFTMHSMFVHEKKYSWD